MPSPRTPGEWERAAVRGLRLIARAAERAARRIQPPVVAPDPTDAHDGGEPAGAGGGYAGMWAPLTKHEALAQIYNTTDESSFNEGGRWDFDRLVPLITPESVVLDLGCGAGRVAQYVAPACAHLWAVDVSPQMLELAADRLRALHNVSFARCRDVTFSDVPSGSVDLAYSLLVLQHVEREDAFLLIEELRRVLRPTGTLVLTFPNLLAEIYSDCFVDYARSGASNQKNRARLYTPQEAEHVLHLAGFDAKLNVGTEIWLEATLR